MKTMFGLGNRARSMNASDVVFVGCLAMALTVSLATAAGVIWVPEFSPAGVFSGGLITRAVLSLSYLVSVIVASIAFVTRLHWTSALPVFVMSVALALVFFLLVPANTFGAALLDHDCRSGADSNEIRCISGFYGTSVYRDIGVPYVVLYRRE